MHIYIYSDFMTLFFINEFFFCKPVYPRLRTEIFRNEIFQKLVFLCQICIFHQQVENLFLFIYFFFFSLNCSSYSLKLKTNLKSEQSLMRYIFLNFF